MDFNKLNLICFKISIKASIIARSKLQNENQRQRTCTKAIVKNKVGGKYNMALGQEKEMENRISFLYDQVGTLNQWINSSLQSE